MALARGDLYFLGRGVCHPAYQLVNRLGGAFLLYLLRPQGVEGIEDDVLIVFIQCQHKESRDASEFKSFCVAYMVSSRYGVDTKGFSFDKLPNKERIKPAL